MIAKYYKELRAGYFFHSQEGHLDLSNLAGESRL
jgi:hypothetical protein